MAYEWIGQAAPYAIGVAGMFFTWLSGKQGRDQVERMATQRHDFERAMAREAREQERLGNAYVRLLGMAERSGQWAQMVKPILDSTPPLSVRPLPELDEQAEVEAVVNAYGSDDVRRELQAWRQIVNDIIAATQLIDFEQSDRGRRAVDVSPEGGYQKLLRLRPEEVRARAALAQQVGKELRSADLAQQVRSGSD